MSEEDHIRLLSTEVFQLLGEWYQRYQEHERGLTLWQ
jgi:hypothetical protein